LQLTIFKEKHLYGGIISSRLSILMKIEFPGSNSRYISNVGTGADPGFNAQERTNKTLTTGPFGNTCEADEVSPEVEAGVVAGLRCLQP
jgi:hypothetical protein